MKLRPVFCELVGRGVAVLVEKADEIVIVGAQLLTRCGLISIKCYRNSSSVTSSDFITSTPV